MYLVPMQPALAKSHRYMSAYAGSRNLISNHGSIVSLHPTNSYVILSACNSSRFSALLR